MRRDEKWRKTFYTYFESIKDKRNITFEEIVNYIYEKTGNIEASFCSKLLSTINPNMPILNQYVLANLDLEVKGKTKEEKVIQNPQTGDNIMFSILRLGLSMICITVFYVGRNLLYK